MEAQHQEQNEENELAELAQILAQMPDEIFAELNFGMNNYDWILPIIEHQNHSDE